MGPTIYASFDDVKTAQTAIGALIHNGVPASCISLAHKTGQVEHAQNSGDGSDLNPAQDDYPRTGSASPTELSSAPPNAQRDYNKGLEADDYNTNYKGDVDRDVKRDLSVDRQRANELGRSTDEGVGPSTSGVYDRMTDPEFQTAHGSEPADSDDINQEFGAMPGVFPDLRAPGPGNSAMGGTIAGAMSTPVGGIAATANASTNVGGMTDFLWGSVSPDFARHYQQAYDGGAAVLIVRAEDGGEIAETAERVLTEHGGQHVQRQGYLA